MSQNTYPKRVDSTLHSGTYVNEDLLSVQDGAAWVIDGTSGFSDRSLTDHPDSDGVWFVETADTFLKEEMDAETPLPEIVATVIERTVDELQAELSIEPTLDTEDGAPVVSDAVSMHELPGATIGLVRWDASTLEYYSLGDSSVLVTVDGTTERYIEGGPQPFDAELCGEIEEYLRLNPDASPDDVRSAFSSTIRESRQYREVPGGFWCLGVNPISARRAVYGHHSIDAVEYVSLFTDGLLNLVDPFEAFDGWDAVAEYIETHGTDAVVERTREIERADPSMREYPRLKPMDDVAVVHLEL